MYGLTETNGSAVGVAGEDYEVRPTSAFVIHLRSVLQTLTYSHQRLGLPSQ